MSPEMQPMDQQYQHHLEQVRNADPDPSTELPEMEPSSE